MKKPNLRLIERRRLTDLIIDQIVTSISNGKLKSGDRLPAEPTLMRQFGVGRGTLREAIGALSLIGVVSVEQGRGTFVTLLPDRFMEKPLSWGLMAGQERIEEIIEARLAVETAIAGLAAEKATKDDLIKIKSLQEELKFKKKYARKGIRTDLAFHLALAEASHNSILKRFFTQLQHPINQWLEQAYTTWGAHDTAVEHHDRILSAVEMHDAEKAKQAMHDHVKWAGENLDFSIFKRHGRPGATSLNKSKDPAPQKL